MDTEQLITRLEADTQQLLTLAKAGDWDTFQQHEQARLTLVAQLEQIDIGSTAEAAQWRDRLLAIRRLNDQLMQLADAETSRLVKEKQAINKGRKMRNAYSTP
ncbi:flagellar protein FliT [Marinobacterium sediminicola]|uniref:Flagellar protein FliT n=1 Tax=Marinobacterium sediminicola TaxID=518898 RepID=A0ABY1RYF0_9GAMM|nr:flagellar protein FliT [Marinobacterium sediminicola]ULG68791.1 flagellar protein FliT [Marinobacterium sediminicola]SMR73321.1 protein FliT [Marinobacterium sediminicola]